MASGRPADRAPSVKDVAALAGVSVGTVSNVINSRGTVRAAVRERVEAAIKDLGYVPNPTAQALRKGVSPLVGVAVFDLTNPFFMEAAAGIEQRLSEVGCIMSLASTHSDPSREAELLRALAGQSVRGILLTPADSDLTVVEEIVARGTPVVLFDSPGTSAGISSVSIDDRAGAARAIEHLLSLGHHSILFLNGPATYRQARNRARGVEDAIARRSSRDAHHDDPTAIAIELREVDSFTADAGRRAMLEFLAEAGVAAYTGSQGIDRSTGPLSPPDLPRGFPTAVFCANDLIAFGAMTAMRDSGVRVPHDVSIVGFDDIGIASEMSTPLTTVHQPMTELGTEAVDLLLRLSADPTATAHMVFSPTLIVRASTSPPSRRPVD